MCDGGLGPFYKSKNKHMETELTLIKRTMRFDLPFLSLKAGDEILVLADENSEIKKYKPKDEYFNNHVNIFIGGVFRELRIFYLL